MLGPDHITSLNAANLLTFVIDQVGEVEPARTLGQDTLERCRRALGPDHLFTLWAAAALTGALVLLGEAEPARTLSEDTLRHCRRTFGPDHPITLHLAEVAVTDESPPGDEATEDNPSPPR